MPDDENVIGTGVGATTGAILGGTLGTIAGPLGVAAGAALGAGLGGYAGNGVEEAYDTYEQEKKKDKEFEDSHLAYTASGMPVNKTETTHIDENDKIVKVTQIETIYNTPKE